MTICHAMSTISYDKAYENKRFIHSYIEGKLSNRDLWELAYRAKRILEKSEGYGFVGVAYLIGKGEIKTTFLYRKT